MPSPEAAAAPENPAERLRRRIEDKTAAAAVVGLGYVGLALAVELARAGYRVTGIEKDPEKVACIGRGELYIGDIEAALFSQVTSDGTLRASSDGAMLAEADIVSICVPTPLRKTKDPDMTYIVEASEVLAKQIRPGMLIILESTTYPGTTEEVILPKLGESGLTVGRDFFLCFSPERVDPGNTVHSTRTIPKVIGGVTERCTELGALFYSKVMDEVVPVSSTRVGEMVKLLENTFRMINIGLANEMALMCRHMNIDVWEVIDAAATKPFGFMPFYPGPGLGGHCVPVDPYYLSWKTKQTGHEARFIELAGLINGQMPRFVVERIQQALNERKKPVNGSRVHIVGVAYKADVADVRESPALDIIGLLEQLGAEISYTDPLVPTLRIAERTIESSPIETAAATDCAVIVTAHSRIDYAKLVEAAPLIFDTRNRLKGVKNPKIVRL